jgi:hypothetical protein
MTSKTEGLGMGQFAPRDVAPAYVAKDETVIFGVANVVDNIAYLSTPSGTYAYRPDLSFFNETKNLVFNSGQSRVYAPLANAPDGGGPP